MSDYMTPAQTENYRASTAKMATSPTNNVGWNYTFRCAACKTTKPTAGRVARGYKLGYRCAECESKRLAKVVS